MTAETKTLGRLLVFFDEPYFRSERDGEEIVTTNRGPPDNFSK